MNENHNTAGIDLDSALAIAIETLRFYADPKNNCPGAAARCALESIELARRSTSGSDKMWTQEELDRAERSIDAPVGDEASGSDAAALRAIFEECSDPDSDYPDYVDWATMTKKLMAWQASGSDGTAAVTETGR